jgi:omega-6 fatty acid desaturase (delta-12 desaturase)
MAASMSAAPAAAAIATSSETPLPLSSLEPDSNVNTQRPRKLSQKVNTVSMVYTNGDIFQLPDYTIGDICKAIPPERFERNALRGLGYIARDILLLSITFWLFHHSVTQEYVPSAIVRGVFWSVYGFLNGLFGTRVMGHGSRVWSPIAVCFESIQ